MCFKVCGVFFPSTFHLPLTSFSLCFSYVFMKMYKTYLYLYESLSLLHCFICFLKPSVCDLLPCPRGKLSQADLINSFWLFLVFLFSSTYLKKTLFQNFSGIKLVIALHHTIREQLRMKGISRDLVQPRGSLPFPFITLQMTFTFFPRCLTHPLQVPTDFEMISVCSWGEVRVQVICKCLTLSWAVCCYFLTPISCSCSSVANINCHKTHEVFICVKKVFGSLNVAFSAVSFSAVEERTTALLGLHLLTGL